MAFTEDLGAFFDTAQGFAVDAVYNGTSAVKVIFDAAYQEALGIAGTNPVALGKASDFPAAAVGKALVLGGVTYAIRGREPVDDGVLVRLQLEKQ